MGRIRGVVDPFPQRGKPPTGMFSSKGSQKMDPVTAAGADVSLKRSAHVISNVDPVKRDNRIAGGGSKGPMTQGKNGGK